MLTLTELERWLALAICVYHGQVHSGLGQTPGGVWAAGVAEHGRPAVVANETAFLVDFLPVVRRSISRTGFVIEHVRYYSDALKPWIADRDRLGRFVIRRDPRDISRVWVLDPVDRLARSVPDARVIGDELAARGVRLSLGGALYDPNDPMGKVFFNILAAFAEFKADLLRMRTREAWPWHGSTASSRAANPNSASAINRSRRTVRRLVQQPHCPVQTAGGQHHVWSRTPRQPRGLAVLRNCDERSLDRF